MKRVVTIQDISCVGKCSLTVALPILSAMGLETAVIPTAVLSTHTAFKGFTFKDLTDEIDGISAHWQALGLEFDAVYTGYLGSKDQIAVVTRFFDRFRTDGNLIVVDPVMGDNGALYAGFTPDFTRAMAEMCGHADLIVPNQTEARFLLGEEYREAETETEALELAKRLSGLGAPRVLVTGVGVWPGMLGATGYDARTGESFHVCKPRIPESFHGTGDIFASCLVGALMNGLGFAEAADLAAGFVVLSMEKTLNDPKHRWYGVNFEQALPELISQIN